MKRLGALALLAMVASAGMAQSDDRFRVGGRVGALEVDNEAFDLIYDGTMIMYGASLGVHWGRGWSVTLSGETGDADGNLIVIDDPPATTGETTTLELRPLHLTAAYDFRVGRSWTIGAGLGATQLSWEETSEFFTTSGSAIGGHAKVDARFQAGSFDVGPELRYWIVPDALDEGGAAAILGDRDLNGLQLSLTVGYRF